MLIDLQHGEPIRFGADSQHGRGAQRVRRGRGRRRRRRRARTGSSCTTSTATDPTLAFALLAPGRRSRTCRRRSACSATSSGRSTRSRCSASSSRRPSAGPGRPRRAHRLRCDLGRRAAPATATARAAEPTARPPRPRPERSDVEAAEHHAGARLRREERRLLRHAHAGDRPRPGSAATDTGRSSTAASAAPFATSAATAGASWRYVDSRRAQRAHRRLEPRRRSPTHLRRERRRAAASSDVGSATQQREPVGVDEPEPAVDRASRRSSAATRFGRVRAERSTVNASAERAARGRCRRCTSSGGSARRSAGRRRARRRTS